MTRYVFIFSVLALALQVFPARSQSRDIYICLYAAPMKKSIAIQYNVYQGVVHSTDGGKTWKSEAWKTSLINDVVRDSATGDMYASSEYGVLRSADKGKTWKQLTGWQIQTVFRTAFDGGAIWIATPHGPWVSRDQGKTWTLMTAGLPPLDGTYAADISIRNGAMLLATADGVYRSTTGAAWKASGLQGTEVDHLARFPGNPAIVAAVCYGSGIWLSSDGGESWSPRNRKLYSKKIQALAFDPENPDIIYIGMNDFPVCKSTDGGATWRTMNKHLTNNNITAVTVDPTDPKRVYLGTENGTWVSDSGGNDWQPFTVRFGYVRSIRVMEGADQ